MEKESTQKTPAKVNITVNGQALQVDPGRTVFQAASDAGIFIPHYCYHPDLSIAGVCRMCTVEIEKNPRLQISCNTVATEGMVVRTDTPRVKDAVKSCLELHLINHPLDCPICDKAGECKLQDFYRGYGLYQSRMEFEKVHKPKVVDIGTIVLDSERCILCTRCVRYTAEVTHTHELGIFNRGDRSELRTYDEEPLRNEYTGNLADICPVGALTAKDFRFQQRVWFLDKTDTFCTFCAHGCNTKVSTNPNTQTLYRVEPRRNVDVNKSWICDKGRWEYHHVKGENRIRVPLRRSDGVWKEYPWEHVFRGLKEKVAANPGGVLFALSTQLTNEEIADSVETAGRLGVTAFTWIVDETVVEERKPYDGILKHRDSTPNALGFERTLAGLGKTFLRHSEVKKGLDAGKWNLVFCLGLEGTDLEWAEKFLQQIPKGTETVLHLTSESILAERADWVLPNVSSFEKSGTMVNALGRLQMLQASLPPQHTSRNAHAVVFGLEQGHDRTQVPAVRAQWVFENQVAPALKESFGALAWRRFEPMGIPTKGA